MNKEWVLRKNHFFYKIDFYSDPKGTMRIIITNQFSFSFNSAKAPKILLKILLKPRKSKSEIPYILLKNCRIATFNHIF